jgi:tetratricopeptide (TPR) repeat protein
MRAIPALIAFLILSAATHADVINLTDGTKVEGKIQRTSDGWAVTQKDGTITTVPADKVASIEASRGAENVSVAADRLASLRRVAEHLSDLQDIVGRYQKFIDQAGDQTVVAEANKDLRMWQDRLDQGLVKLGDKWITADERQRRRELAQSEALPAKDLILNYHYKDAEKILQQALEDDPECAAALYLQGVALYKQDQVAQARKFFDAVNQVVHSHAPTLNNLAVIAWRQKSFVVAMSFYGQAMMATPQAKEILDNVAEALNAIPDDNKKAPVVIQAVSLFADQDAQLQQAAAQQGLYRWGATWVTAKQLQDLKAAEAKVKQQLDNIQQQFDALQQKIGEIDSEMSANQGEMDRHQARSMYTDQNGNSIQMPLPDIYYQLRRDNEKLANDKRVIQQGQIALKNREKQVQQEIPVPKFTGLQQIIGVDGVPLRDLPGTMPTTTNSQAN